MPSHWHRLSRPLRAQKVAFNVSRGLAAPALMPLAPRRAPAPPRSAGDAGAAKAGDDPLETCVLRLLRAKAICALASMYSLCVDHQAFAAAAKGGDRSMRMQHAMGGGGA
jgi:hypothetical protein